MAVNRFFEAHVEKCGERLGIKSKPAAGAISLALDPLLEGRSAALHPTERIS
ncbi:MAG: hypothetical protein KME47_08630 [Nodosilinea sp. WJT8-NPBG4]|nr:hypothetical protein [Nodosilinea sp. WJT8-NPBG4]